MTDQRAYRRRSILSTDAASYSDARRKDVTNFKGLVTERASFHRSKKALAEVLVVMVREDEGSRGGGGDGERG